MGREQKKLEGGSFRLSCQRQNMTGNDSTGKRKNTNSSFSTTSLPQKKGEAFSEKDKNGYH